jgi:hypothetical protein
VLSPLDPIMRVLVYGPAPQYRCGGMLRRAKKTRRAVRLYPGSFGVLLTICADKEDEDATAIMAGLATGRLKVVPTAQRDSTSPDDWAAFDKLRAECRAYRGTRGPLRWL